MANARHNNSIYLDSTGSVAVDSTKPRIYKIFLTPLGPGARLLLKETNDSGTIKVDFRVQGNDLSTREMDFGSGLDITGTFYVSQIVQCVAVVVGDFYLKVS